jgi:periplasmic divalent cation tolerance protein
MTDKKLVFTTCGSLEEAEILAQALVERQLAACVNMVPQVHSVYRWQGKVETADEFLLIIKTTAGAFKKLRDVLTDLHSYDVPECVEIAIEDGNGAYLDWIEESVKVTKSRA